MKEKALILINIGTPKSPSKKDVKRFLTPFLNDKYVIDIPYLLRKILVNGIIIPFRLNNSSKAYNQLWTKDGSPLQIHQDRLQELLNESLNNYDVYSAMRYTEPSIKQALLSVKKKGYKDVIILPLYPQYAQSTTLSTIEKVKQIASKIVLNTKIRYVEHFYMHKAFIKAFSHNILKHDLNTYSHVVFSFHGLPNKQVQKLHPNIDIAECSDRNKFNSHNKRCYKAACYHTAELLANECAIKNFSVSFQSRLSKDWLNPFTDNKLNELLEKGNKKILIVAPSFVADCLETVVELGIEYKDDFIKNGGEKLTLVESLNSSQQWVEAIKEIIEDKTINI